MPQILPLYLLTILFVSPLGRIVVNIDCPEANGPFLVFPLGNIQGVKTEERYAGFSIQFLADKRWILEDDTVEPYTGRVWGEDGVLIKMPAFPYLILKNRDILVAHSRVSEEMNNAIDDTRHSFVNDKANRMWAYYLLEFPPGVTLSSSLIFADAGDDEELDYDLVEFEYRPANEMHDAKEMWAHFTVARTDMRASKRGKVDEGSKKSRAAAKLASLGNA